MFLAIETSSEPASLSLFRTDGTFTTRVFANKNQVNVPLADELATLLVDFNEPLQAVLVGAGPGSYSGARVGLATAEAVALTHNCPVVTLPSIHGIKYNSPILIGDARRGAFFISIAEDEYSLKVLDKDAFLEEYAKIPSGLKKVSFEAPKKLPLPDEEKESIEVIYSTSEQLIRYWNSLSQPQQETKAKEAREIIYLRPPNITKAKSPF